MTAADLARTTRARLSKIKGLKGVVDDLLRWKDAVDQGFVFNPQQGVSPIDMLRVKADMLTRRAAVEQRLLTEIKAAEDMRSLLLRERSHVRPSVQLAWGALQQANVDERALARWI